MKEVILIIVLIFPLFLFSQEFEINKIDEIAYAQSMTGPESIQIVDDNLYYLTTNGLEIYEINEDGIITKISMLTIARPGRLIMQGQYCFLVSGSYDSSFPIPGHNLTIYKININDVYNPIIVDQIGYEEFNSYSSMVKFGDYLIFKWFGTGGFHYDFYSIPELEYVGQVISDHHHRVVSDSLLVRQDGYTLYIEQYNPPDEFEVVGVIDVSAYSDGNYAYDHFKVKNDTILSAVNLKNITFWDISDETNWQYLSRYTLPEEGYIFGNKQYAIMNDCTIIFDTYLLRLLDISDITTPTLVDSTERTLTFYGQACNSYYNNLYVSSSNYGIQHYSVGNNDIEHSGSYYDHRRFYIGNMYDDKIIASNLSTGLTSDGYTLFDIEDPLNPVDLGEWFSGKYYRLIHKQGGWIVLSNYEDYTLELYDIADLENPILRNTLPLDNYGYYWNYCFIDKSDPNSFYLCNYLNNMFWKFDISEPGEPVEMFEYELPSAPEGFTVINSIAYVTCGEDAYNLLVIDGLDENEPYIANDIYNFTVNKYLDNQDGYLIANVPYHSSIAQIFQLEDPLQPELYFTPQWGERIEVEGNLIFSKLNHIVGVYENRPNSTEPIAVFNGLNYIYNINSIEYEGTDYLITNEMANIGLFEYTYTPSSAEDELPKPEISLSNYPNPFNPETTIVYNLPESGKVKLEVFNIKGQLVKTLLNEEMQKGKHSIIWSGLDSNNKPVSSGIYLYKIKAGNQESVKRMILLK